MFAQELCLSCEAEVRGGASSDVRVVLESVRRVIVSKYDDDDDDGNELRSIEV